MKISRRHATIGGFGLLAGASLNTSAQAQQKRSLKSAVEDAKEEEEVWRATRLTSKELARRTVYRRAVDAVIWGLPLVGEDAVKQAAFRDGKANYNDIVWWPKGGGWKNQSPTPNVNTRYMYFFINTKQDGPVVVELPPAVPGASFYGTIEDAWYVPLMDIGFEGKGGKYLVLPPDYKGDVPDGYIAGASRDLQHHDAAALHSGVPLRKGCAGGQRAGEAGQNLPLVEGCQPTRAAPPRHDRRHVQRPHQV